MVSRHYHSIPQQNANLIDAVQWSGKNQQENANLALRQVKTWAELLNTFCTSGKLELELLYKVQVQCYEDTKQTAPVHLPSTCVLVMIQAKLCEVIGAVCEVAGGGRR